MRIAILSDARFPTSLTYQGHGLGRSVARIGSTLAKRGHWVTIYALPGSYIEGCELIATTDEGDLLARQVLAAQDNYDVIIDSTHLFKTMYLAPRTPIIAKVCDSEGRAPYNRVFGTTFHAAIRSESAPVIIPEGIDVDSIPFNGGPRREYFVAAALKVAWKRLDLCVAVAQYADREVRVYGNGDEFSASYSRAKSLEAIAPPEFYNILSDAHGFISAVPSVAMLEAAATGTPSLCFVNDESICDGITGFVRPTALELAEVSQELSSLNHAWCREWVAENRSLEATTSLWERLLEEVINGRRW